MLIDVTERQSAESFIALYDPRAMRRGEKRLSRGFMGPVWLVRNGVKAPVPIPNRIEAYHSTVTELILNDGGWRTNCSCHLERCEHSYAGFLALLKIGSRDQAKSARSNGNGTPN